MKKDDVMGISAPFEVFWTPDEDEVAVPDFPEPETFAVEEAESPVTVAVVPISTSKALMVSVCTTVVPAPTPEQRATPPS